jgi:uncharacterized protein YecT (DUF1311 family)
LSTIEPSAGAPPSRRLPLALAVLAALSLAVHPPKAAAQASSGACPDARSTVEMRECFDRAFRAADAELNRVYAALQRKSDSRGRTLLRSSQRAWIAYRDAECRFRASESEGGTLYPVELLSCRTDLTKDRTRELRKSLDGGR